MVEPLPRSRQEAIAVLNRHIRSWPGPNYYCVVCRTPAPCEYRATAVGVLNGAGSR